MFGARLYSGSAFWLGVTPRYLNNHLHCCQALQLLCTKETVRWVSCTVSVMTQRVSSLYLHTCVYHNLFLLFLYLCARSLSCASVVCSVCVYECMCVIKCLCVCTCNVHVCAACVCVYACVVWCAYVRMYVCAHEYVLVCVCNRARLRLFLSSSIDSGLGCLTSVMTSAWSYGNVSYEHANSFPTSSTE